MRTRVHTNRQGLFNTTTTLRAVLRRPVGIHCDKLSPGSSGLVEQHVQEVTPTGISNALGNVTAGQALDVQVFDGNEAKPFDYFVRQLVVKVAALIRRALVQSADLPGKLPVLPASSFASGSAALQNRQLLFRCPEPTGIVDRLAGGQCGKCLQAHVDPDGRSSYRGGIRIGQFQLKDNEPVAQAVPLEDCHLDLGIVRQGAMLENPYQANVLYIEPPISETDTVIVDIADRLEPTTALVARIAGLFAGLHAAKEAVKGLAQSTQGLLERGKVAPGRIFIELTDWLELVGLIVIADADTAALPRLTPFGKRIVVDRAVDVEHPIQKTALYAIGIEAVLVRQIHLAPLLLLDVAPDCLGRDVPGSSNVITARPQRRQTAVQFGKLFAQLVARTTFNTEDDLVDCYRRWERSEQVNVIGHYSQVEHFATVLLDDWWDQLCEPLADFACKHGAPKLRTPHEVIVYLVCCVAGSFRIHKRILPHLRRNVKGVAALRAARIPLPPEGGSTLREVRWKDVTGFEGLYQVSNMGRVKSFCQDKIHGQILRPWHDNNGYLKVNLYRDGKCKTMYVHRLVAKAFLPRQPGKDEINHKSGVRDDPRPENLEWCTAGENLLHCYRVLGRDAHPPHVFGEAHSMSKLTEEDVKEIRKLYATGEWTQVELGRMFGVAANTISVVVNRKTWKHVP